mmetsp:Transcript_23387/g.64893  ORF Transcript_23387/g.64893 Transcript_23387/m.64893 type:complete len:239 (+) Transcript_23387:1012-1728(+)
MGSLRVRVEAAAGPVTADGSCREERPPPVRLLEVTPSAVKVMTEWLISDERYWLRSAAEREIAKEDCRLSGAAVEGGAGGAPAAARDRSFGEGSGRRSLLAEAAEMLVAAGGWECGCWELLPRPPVAVARAERRRRMEDSVSVACGTARMASERSEVADADADASPAVPAGGSSELSSVVEEEEAAAEEPSPPDLDVVLSTSPAPAAAAAAATAGSSASAAAITARRSSVTPLAAALS